MMCERLRFSCYNLRWHCCVCRAVEIILYKDVRLSYTRSKFLVIMTIFLETIH